MPRRRPLYMRQPSALHVSPTVSDGIEVNTISDNTTEDDISEVSELSYMPFNFRESISDFTSDDQGSFSHDNIDEISSFTSHNRGNTHIQPIKRPQLNIALLSSCSQSYNSNKTHVLQDVAKLSALVQEQQSLVHTLSDIVANSVQTLALNSYSDNQDSHAKVSSIKDNRDKAQQLARDFSANLNAMAKLIKSSNKRMEDLSKSSDTYMKEMRKIMQQRP